MKEAIFYIIFMLIFGGICVLMEVVSGYISCKQKGEVLELSTEYHYWTGCVVTKPNGEKVLFNQIRELNSNEQ